MLLRRFLPGRSASLLVSPLLWTALLFSAFGPLPVRAGDVLETNGFSSCLSTSDIKVTRMNIKYDRSTHALTFDLAGSSEKVQNVTAVLTVTAYGREVYRNEFDPCQKNLAQLCPLSKGEFAAKDEMVIQDSYSSMIPEIAFQVPDLDGMAKLELRSSNGGASLACLESVVQNGKTADQSGVKYVTAGIAAAALVLSGISAAGAVGAGSGAGPSPNFGDVMFWFQNIAMNGMMSVSYPPVYRSFSNNFAWSTGIIPWKSMQVSIDSFRASTGGHLDKMSIEYLLNSTLVYGSDNKSSNSTNSTNSTVTRRGLEWTADELFRRAVDANGTDATSTNSTGTEKDKAMHYVNGIQAYVEKLQIPSANTFMTVLLIFCIVIAAIAVCILLFKVILEVWSFFASFPKALTGFRKRYWEFLATTIVRLVLILYGTWTLYCMYQFRNGDSWAAHLLAGITLAIFTGVLAFFAVKIFKLARAKKAADAEYMHNMTLDGSGESPSYEKLFEHKAYMRRYGLFYDQFKTSFWWVFLPLIIYAFAKGAFIALGDGHGLVQTAGQLVCEAFLLVLLLWNRPYNTKAGNILNIIIAVVRVLSVGCLIIFVEELGISADTKTVTGVALVVIQSVLTAALAICIAVNAIYVTCKENPHIKKRKEMEKQRDADLTPLSARNSLLGDPMFPGAGSDGKGRYSQTPTQDTFNFNIDPSGQSIFPLHHLVPAPEHEHPAHKQTAGGRTTPEVGLVGAAAPMPYADNGRERYQSAHYEGNR